MPLLPSSQHCWCGTVSKLGLAGIRRVPRGRPEWIAQINKVRQAYTVNVLTQAAHSSCWRSSTCSSSSRRIRQGTDLLGSALRALKNITVYPRRPFFWCA